MIATTTNLVQYDGNDSTTVFPYAFRVDDEDHLVAVVADADDNQTPLTVNVDFTVTGIGVEGGGDVTYPIAGDPLPTGSTITIYRIVPLTQDTDFHNQGGFFPETHEAEFDYVIMAIQQLQEQIDRCVKSSVTSQIDGDDVYDTLIALQAAAAAALVAALAAQAAAEAIQAELEAMYADGFVYITADHLVYLEYADSVIKVWNKNVDAVNPIMEI